MDNNKIGKLIADLRRKQGLTQEQLGEKVGVGFRSVSKWECGKTLPDIGIVNELSKILGISSDELLSGELKNKDNNSTKKKISPKIIITISILTIILIFISSIVISQKNKTYTYRISSANESEYYVKGIANYNNGKISVSINTLYFKDKEFNKTIIENYEYKITIKEKFLFGYGYIETVEALNNPANIAELTNNLKINFNSKIKVQKKDIDKNNMLVNIKFLTSQNETFEKELKLNLVVDKTAKK